MRRRIYYFLRHKIFKIQDGERDTGLLLIIKYILFPLYGINCKMKGIDYDFVKDVYTINGIKISGSYFYALETIDVGKIFKIIKKEKGIITIERIINNVAI